jgi:hypothetical protein
MTSLHHFSSVLVPLLHTDDGGTDVKLHSAFYKTKHDQATRFIEEERFLIT